MKHLRWFTDIVPASNKKKVRQIPFRTVKFNQFDANCMQNNTENAANVNRMRTGDMKIMQIPFFCDRKPVIIMITISLSP